MAGLKAAGLDARTGAPPSIAAGDVVVIWNRYGEMHELATRAEKAGAVVLVAENGYLERPHFGGQHYALARGGHNGQGEWLPRGPGRWDALGIELKPWHGPDANWVNEENDGRHILVAPNRSFGRPGYIMPPNWSADVCKRLARVTRRPVRVRMHPGSNAPKVPLAQDLANCWAVVIWSSSVGVHALIAGVPVIAECPAWICKRAALADIREIEAPWGRCSERLPALMDMAWAQWTCDELATGEPFRRLLSA